MSAVGVVVAHVGITAEFRVNFDIFRYARKRFDDFGPLGAAVGVGG